MLKSDVVGVGGKVGWSGYLVVVEMGWVDERKLRSASPLYTFLKAWPSTGTHAKHRTKARTRKMNDVGHDDVSRHLLMIIDELEWSWRKSGWKRIFPT